MIGQATSLSNVTDSAIEGNVARFKEEVKRFKEKNKIKYSKTRSETLNETEEAARRGFGVTQDFAEARRGS